MTQKTVKTSGVVVYKVLASSMNEAFHILKIQNSLDNHSLEVIDKESLPEKMVFGEVYKISRRLYPKFKNNSVSEFTVYGALYNKKPIITPEEHVVIRNVVSRGTKKWETINSYRTDNNEEVHVDTGTKAESFEVAKTLAQQHGESINVVLAKRLSGHDGILGVAEVIKTNNTDKGSTYIFWVYDVKIESIEDDELIEANTIEEGHGQLAIKEDLTSYFTRQSLLN